MNRLTRLTATIAATAVAVVGLGFVSMSASSADPAPRIVKQLEGDMHASSYGLVLNVKNDSTYTLFWAGDLGHSPSNSPKLELPPGGTDRITYKGDSTGMMARPQYLVGNTGYSVYPAFGVPLAGSNATSCSPNDMSSYQSPVGPTSCKIGSGWEPDAHVTFGNRTPK
jgi:hypothetical protein